MSTIARGLVTLKHNKPVLADALRNARFSGVFVNGTEVSTGTEVKKFNEDARKSFQSIRDKIEAEFDLRKRINKANVENTVMVGEIEMSINDALTYRTHIVPQLKQLLQKLKTELAGARSVYSDKERAFSDKLVRTGDDAELRALLETREKPSILDIQEQIDNLTKEIQFFDVEFDAVLTEKNPVIAI